MSTNTNNPLHARSPCANPGCKKRVLQDTAVIRNCDHCGDTVFCTVDCRRRARKTHRRCPGSEFIKPPRNFATTLAAQDNTSPKINADASEDTFHLSDAELDRLVAPIGKPPSSMKLKVVIPAKTLMTYVEEAPDSAAKTDGLLLPSKDSITEETPQTSIGNEDESTLIDNRETIIQNDSQSSGNDIAIAGDLPKDTERLHSDHALKSSAAGTYQSAVSLSEIKSDMQI